jgi:hypothetical protein
MGNLRGQGDLELLRIHFQYRTVQEASTTPHRCMRLGGRSLRPARIRNDAGIFIGFVYSGTTHCT